jgi:RNA polymerase sigma factor for flagellar operon FliA
MMERGAVMEFDSALIQKVHKIAVHIHRLIPSEANVDLDDLVQDGMIGLLDANQRYDPSKGASLMGFASARINGAIRDGMRSQDWCGRSARAVMKHVRTTTLELIDVLGREPTSEEKAAAANLSLEQFYQARNLEHAAIPISLSTPVARLDTGSTIEDTIADDRNTNGFEMLVMKEHKQLLRDAFRKLNAKERQAVWLYYFDTNEYNLEEIAHFMGIGASRVSQLCTNARKKLEVELRKHGEFASYGKPARALANDERMKSQQQNEGSNIPTRSAILRTAAGNSNAPASAGVL